MNDEKLEEYLRVVEPNFNSHIEKGTIEMSNEYYNLFEERMARLINKNKNLQSKIDKAIELIEKEDLIKYFRETKDLELANEFEDLYKDLKEDK